MSLRSQQRPEFFNQENVDEGFAMLYGYTTISWRRICHTQGTIIQPIEKSSENIGLIYYELDRDIHCFDDSQPHRLLSTKVIRFCTLSRPAGPSFLESGAIFIALLQALFFRFSSFPLQI
ncbi:hypothetical protein PM082_024336 [Marasmius tenuissimus]|nr:hypothetical protein PM082_024336 [Marasmius tenuissimus]